ncbi:unnamed protein product [Effrenium voratum]|uniref:Uncharacterized protein n=1 Tax=Effrenium voratum TaxID=2562239 RepID=A0AA36MVD5_9DINO|nr:unnamed protein product [Effrenium voratum]
MDIASLAGEPLAKVADPLNAGTVEGALTGLLKAGSEATNNTAVAGTILDIVNVSMKEKLYAAHNESLKKIEEASQQFNDCLTTYKAADEVRFPPTSLLQTNGSNGSAWYEEYFEAYSWCKSYEANLSVQTQDCEYYCLKETQTIDQQCVALDEESATSWTAHPFPTRATGPSLNAWWQTSRSTWASTRTGTSMCRTSAKTSKARWRLATRTATTLWRWSSQRPRKPTLGAARPGPLLRAPSATS